MIQTIYMETTKKEPEETLSEIQSILRRYKLKRLMNDYDENGMVAGCIFSIIIGEKEIPIKLPVNWKPLYEMAKKGKTKYIYESDVFNLYCHDFDVTVLWNEPGILIRIVPY